MKLQLLFLIQTAHPLTDQAFMSTCWVLSLLQILEKGQFSTLKGAWGESCKETSSPGSPIKSWSSKGEACQYDSHLCSCSLSALVSLGLDHTSTALPVQAPQHPSQSPLSHVLKPHLPVIAQLHATSSCIFLPVPGQDSLTLLLHSLYQSVVLCVSV